MSNKFYRGLSLLEVSIVLILVSLAIVFVRNDEKKFNEVIHNKNLSALMVDVSTAAEMYFSSTKTKHSSLFKLDVKELVSKGFLSSNFKLPSFVNVSIYAVPFLNNTVTPYFNVLTVFRLNRGDIDREQISVMLGRDGGKYKKADGIIYGNMNGWLFNIKNVNGLSVNDVKESDFFLFRRVDAKMVDGGMSKVSFLGQNVIKKDSSWEWKPTQRDAELIIKLDEWNGFYQWDIKLTKQFDNELIFFGKTEKKQFSVTYGDIFKGCYLSDGWYTVHLEPKPSAFDFNIKRLKSLSLNIYVYSGGVKC